MPGQGTLAYQGFQPLEKMMQVSAAQSDPRPRLLRRLHALGRRKGLDHEMLRDIGCQAYQVTSLGELTAKQLRDFIQRLSVKSEDVPPEYRPRPSRPSPLQGGTTGGSESIGRCKRQAPRGKVRPEGVIWLPTDKQRAFIASLLDRLFCSFPDPLRAANDYVHHRIRPDYILRGPLDSYTAIADGVTTGKAAGMLINCLVGELKRRGVWK